MKPHYFDQDKPDEDDIPLKMAIHQGYVPETCLLNGIIVWNMIEDSKDPCEGCNCSRDKCNGRAFDKEKEKQLNRQDFKIDKSKLGYIDRLCLVDIERDSIEIFITDLVTNKIIFSRTLKDELISLIHQAIHIALTYSCTRIVFDTEPGASGKTLDYELDELIKDKFPFEAVKQPEQPLFDPVKMITDQW